MKANNNDTGIIQDRFRHVCTANTKGRVNVLNFRTQRTEQTSFKGISLPHYHIKTTG